MKQLGRLIVREQGVVGVFFPNRNEPMTEGVWAINEVLGEMQLKYLGPPKMHRARFNALSPTELVHENVKLLTVEEYDRLIDEEAINKNATSASRDNGSPQGCFPVTITYR